MIDTALTLIAPHLCSGCGLVGTLLCDNCKYDITQESIDGCLLCQKPSRSGICLDHRTPYDRAWYVGERKDTLQRLIGSYKFQNAKAASSVLGDLLDKHLPILPANTIIVPIPTVRSHVRERGYDHMQLIAKRLAKRRLLPIRRVIDRHTTATQHHASRAERIKQASSTFHLNKPIDPTAQYLILDDVVTTGATVEYASKLLKEAGAQSVWVAAIARQTLD